MEQSGGVFITQFKDSISCYFTSQKIYNVRVLDVPKLTFTDKGLWESQRNFYNLKNNLLLDGGCNIVVIIRGCGPRDGSSILPFRPYDKTGVLLG